MATTKLLPSRRSQSRAGRRSGPVDADKLPSDPQQHRPTLGRHVHRRARVPLYASLKIEAIRILS